MRNVIRTRLGLLGLCAIVLGLMAVTTSVAHAALFEWLVLEKGAPPEEWSKTAKLVTSPLVVEAEKETPDVTLLTKLLKRAIAITCTKFTVTGVSLEAEGKLTTGGKVKFEGCEAYGKGTLEEKLGCKVHSAGQPEGTIETNKGKGALLLHEPVIGVTELVTKIEPETGTVFATFLTEGCILPESNPVNGKLFVRDCEGMAELHLLKHLIEALKALTSLWVGADTAEHLETSIDGSAWVFLKEDFLWGAEHNKP